MPSFDSTAAPPPRAFRVLALPPSGPDLLEGAAVLAEVPGDTGVLLFQSLRNVTLWSAAGREERAALFAPGAEARRRAALESAAPDEALRPALETLARLLGAPAAVRAAEVADACEQVARWAEERSAPATALAFLRAAVRAGRDIQRGRRPRVRGGKCEGGEAAGEGESWTGRGTSGKMGVFQV